MLEKREKWPPTGSKSCRLGCQIGSCEHTGLESPLGCWRCCTSNSTIWELFHSPPHQATVVSVKKVKRLAASCPVQVYLLDITPADCSGVSKNVSRIWNIFSELNVKNVSIKSHWHRNSLMCEMNGMLLIKRCKSSLKLCKVILR